MVLDLQRTLLRTPLAAVNAAINVLRRINIVFKKQNLVFCAVLAGAAGRPSE